MSMIDEILNDIVHDIDCASFKAEVPCDCGADRQKKYLERLKEPTEGMVSEGTLWFYEKNWQVHGRTYATRGFANMLQAAEEDL